MCFVVEQIPERLLGLGLQGPVNLIWGSPEPFLLCIRFAPTGDVTRRPCEISSVNGETLFSTFPSEQLHTGAR